VNEIFQERRGRHAKRSGESERIPALSARTLKEPQHHKWRGEHQKQQPNKKERSDRKTGPFRHCLSYTAVELTFLPFASVAVVVTVRILPFVETTTRPVNVTLLPCFALNDNVRAPNCL